MGCLVCIRGRIEGFPFFRRSGGRCFGRFVNAAGGARGTEHLLEPPGGLRIRTAFEDQLTGECGLVESFGGIGVDARKAGDDFFMDLRILRIIPQHDTIAGFSHDSSLKAAAVL